MRMSVRMSMRVRETDPLTPSFIGLYCSTLRIALRLLHITGARTSVEHTTSSAEHKASSVEHKASSVEPLLQITGAL